MIGSRLIQLGGARLVAALAIACLLLAALLIVSVLANVHQFRSAARVVTSLTSQLAASEAKSASELNACAAVNANVASTVEALGVELHQCRGQEQKLEDARRLALRQRDRARAAAEGEVRVRTEAIAAIVRNDANCSRPVCRALSDELLGSPSDDKAE